jgi:DUF4097 and DUF4098 domain-containing protein YvlB
VELLGYAAALLPTIAGFWVWSMQRKILKRDERKEREEAERRKAQEAKERDREELELCLIESVNATRALSEATAKAVQRIPDAHCNGDMHAALHNVEEVKRRQTEFLTKKGVHSIL